VATVFTDKNVFIAHVGDSRIYRVRDGKLTQLTADHSLLNEYIRMNFVQKDEADSFPLKNVIVRALGLSDFVEVDVARKTAKPGDLFLLCTDGLSDLVPDDQIAEALEGAVASQEGVDKLIQLALDAGGVDNITVALIGVEEEE